jgi:hypothetical protein
MMMFVDAAAAAADDDDEMMRRSLITIPYGILSNFKENVTTTTEEGDQICKMHSFAYTLISGGCEKR